MYKHLKTIVIALALVIAGACVAIPVLASAADNGSVSREEQAENTAAVQTPEDAQTVIVSEANEKSSKSFSAAAVVGVVAAVGAVSMGIAISKAVEGVARQPEAGGKIQTMLMLGLVFIETAIIYALIVAILIIFVL